MPGRKWSDLEQEAWLKKQFPAFIQAEASSRRRQFFVDICAAWQAAFPDPEPSDDLLEAAGGDRKAAVTAKRKAKDKVSTKIFRWELTYPNMNEWQQIKAWFDNHKRPTLTGVKNQGSRALLNLSKPRTWHAWQAYSDLKYKDWKDEIDTEYTAAVEKWKIQNPEGEINGEKKPNRFIFQNTFLREKNSRPKTTKWRQR